MTPTVGTVACDARPVACTALLRSRTSPPLLDTCLDYSMDT